MTWQPHGANEVKIHSLIHPTNIHQSLTRARRSGERSEPDKRISLISQSSILAEGERQSTCTQIRLVHIWVDAVKTLNQIGILESTWTSFRYKVKEALSKEAAF